MIAGRKKSSMPEGLRRRTCLLALILAIPLAGRAAELLAARLYTVPERIFIHQPFEIYFELEVTPGSDVEDLRISDFPNDPALLEVERLETVGRTPGRRDGQNVDILRFKTRARGLQPMDQTFHPRAQCQVVRRRAFGFFSQWYAQARQIQLEPFALRIEALPEAGRPDDFSGAVGVFRLTGSLSSETAHPGDILILTLEIAGQGWLGDAALPEGPASPYFKYYPARERLREPSRLRVEQAVIPLSTQAVELPALRFVFFNPVTAAYEASVTGPFRLTLTEEPSTTNLVESVRVIRDEEAPARVERPGAQALTVRMDETLRQYALALLAACLAALVALFLYAHLRPSRPRLALAVAAALLAAGLAVALKLAERRTVTRQPLARLAEARLAPAPTALRLFTLHPGAAVTPLERANGWARVEATGGRRGWIPLDALEPDPPPP